MSTTTVRLQNLNMYSIQIRHSTRTQEGNCQLRAMSKNCVSVARLRLHVVYVSPPPRETRGPTMGQSSRSPCPSVAQHTATERRAISWLSAASHWQTIDRVHRNQREAFDSLQKSHFSLQPLRLLICFLCNNILCQILQTLNYRSILRESCNY